MSGIGYQRYHAKLAARKADPFKALYPGICGVCSERINIGDPIARKSGKYRDRYVHTTCLENDE